MWFSVCNIGKKKAPDLQEVYNKMESIRNQGNQNLEKLDRLMKNDSESYQKLIQLKKSNEKLDKDVKDIDQKSNMILSKLDIINKTDEEILQQIHNLEENDSVMQELIKNLGENDEEILKSIKDIVNKQEIMSQKLNTLNENDSKIKKEMASMKDNQREMSETIKELGNEMTQQFKNLTLHDQDILRQQVSLGLKQNITATKLDLLGERLEHDKVLILEEIKKVGFEASFSTYVDKIQFAIRKYHEMNRYSFNIYKNDKSMDRFKSAADAKLEEAIFGVFKMLIEGSISYHSIFKELNQTCNFDFLQYFVSLLHQGISLRKNALSMERSDPR